LTTDRLSKAPKLTHVGLAVSDLDRAAAFYSKAFGYRVVFQDRGMADLIQGVTGIPGLSCDLAQLRSPTSEHVVELIAFRLPARARLARAPVRPGQGHVAFASGRFDQTLARLQDLGAVLVGGVTEFPEGRSAYLREPSGSFVELDEER
jgi:catechol 2,3-dioxygenase-like lactoylglutathione lyase family enzyme